jgi:putative transposase
MPDKFQNKYRISSARLKGYDYGKNGAYFITICTHKREHYFGQIKNKTMCLNEIGHMVKNEWLITPEIRPDMNLELGEFVVMPNHFHAILIIGDNEYNRGFGDDDRDAMHGVSMHGVSAKTTNQFGPQRKNVSSVIRGFKSSVTKNAKIINPDFAWQPRFHDHIIRNEKSFNNISNYIINNPMNWDKDKFHDTI